MNRRQLLRMLPKVRAEVKREISGYAGRGTANEGYAGGYADALSDVEAVLTHGHPADKWGFWRKAGGVIMSEWQSIETIPVGRIVQVKTLRGIVCAARHGTSGARWLKRADRFGPKRAYCSRVDLPSGYRGDVVAVAWRELTPERAES